MYVRTLSVHLAAQELSRLPEAKHGHSLIGYPATGTPKNYMEWLKWNH